MKHGRFLGFALPLGVVVVGALAWLAPAVHGQAEKPQERVDRKVRVVVEDEPGPTQARRVLEVLGDRGSRMGVSIRDLDESDVKAGKTGVVVDDVRENSPAAQAGIKTGDVIGTFDGERVRSARHLARLVQETPSGRSVKTQVWRDGKSIDLTVTPSADQAADTLRHFEWRGEGGEPFRFEMPPNATFLPKMDVRPFENFDVRVFAQPARLGVGVQELTPELAEYFGVKEGLLVTSVKKDSPAAKAGLKAGDVITSVDGAAVDDAAELRQRLSKDDPAEVTVGLVRDKKVMSMKVTLEPGEKKVQKLRTHPV